jgi:hypothetical protein
MSIVVAAFVVYFLMSLVVMLAFCRAAALGDRPIKS